MTGSRSRARDKKWLTMVTLAVSLPLLLAVSLPVGAIEGGIAKIDPPVLSSANPTVLVHAAPGLWRSALQSARSWGLEIGTRHRMIDVFVATGPRSSVIRLASHHSVWFIEHNARLAYATDTSHQATRAEAVLNGKVKVQGRPIDGRGVGVAIVDSGVDGTHPDLETRMGGNVMIVCSRPGFLIGPASECGGPKEVVEADDTDSLALSGHGTHVAGIVAGTGASSDGTYHGAARGATLYGVGMGTVLLVTNALDGLRWVLDNHDLVKPRIRVVNNSWGSGYDPEDAGSPETRAITKMINALVKDGVTVVFSASNLGGDGSEARTSLECAHPAPGVVCVAGYDDMDMGSRAGSISSTSSRGDIGDPATWPDVSAPGSAIVSTCRVTLPVCTSLGEQGSPQSMYATMSGTSMAAPHVTGVITLLYQVRPSLTPAQVEDIVEDTAYKFDWGAPYEPDPFNRNDKSSFEKGHGLIDAVAAIRKILADR